MTSGLARSESEPLEPEPAAAATVFGAALPSARRYVELLADAGITRGLIGPRERGRLWTRHLLNCAVVQELVPRNARIVDVGSGAGLPGIPLALARPDLSVTLVEPLERRCAFLHEAIDRLALQSRIAVVRGRIEDAATCAEVVDAAVGGAVDVVTARALAPLARLVTWCVPVVRPGGLILALKGETAAEEVARDRKALARLEIDAPSVVACGEGMVDPPATVVVMKRLLRRSTVLATQPPPPAQRRRRPQKGHR